MDRVILKWSGKFGQRAKMYPTRTNGCKNDKPTEFSDKVKKAENKEGEIKDLHAKIGQLTVKNDICHKG